MPFISTNRVAKRPSPIRIILERLMIVSCDDIITLNAQVPSGVNARTYEWVQLSGLIVTWLTDVHDPMVMFQQTLVRDDKVFRFYVNRGTASETYEDILVTAIPRDDMPGLVSPIESYGQHYADEEVAYATIVPGFSVDDYSGSYNNTTRGVTWNLPTVSNYGYNPSWNNFIREFRVYDVTGGATETLIATLTPPSTSFFSFPRQRSIRIDTVVVRNGIEHIAKGIPAGFFPPTGWADADLYDRGRVHPLGGNFSYAVTRQAFTTFQNTYQTDAQVSILDTPSGLLNTVTRYQLSLTGAPTQQSDALVHPKQAQFYQTVTRLDLGIGGLG